MKAGLAAYLVRYVHFQLQELHSPIWCFSSVFAEGNQLHCGSLCTPALVGSSLTSSLEKQNRKTALRYCGDVISSATGRLF